MKITKHKYTLIQLLVVVAIIAIILAFLFSGIRWAWIRGRVTSNANRLKQIGQACIMYSQDNDTNSWPTPGTLDSAKLGSKYISSETLSSLDGAAFTLDGVISAGSAPTDTAIKDTSINGFANILYADGHVVTATNTGSSSSEEESVAAATIPSFTPTEGEDPWDNALYGIMPEAGDTPYMGNAEAVAAMQQRDQVYYQHPFFKDDGWAPVSGENGCTAQMYDQYMNFTLPYVNGLLVGTGGGQYAGDYRTYAEQMRTWPHLTESISDDLVARATTTLATVKSQMEILHNNSGLSSAEYDALLDQHEYTGPDFDH